MLKFLSIIYLCIACGTVSRGQTAANVEALKSYGPAQKRLLVVSTVHVINLISQHSLDQDSITVIACKVSGLPFLTPYTEGLDDQSSPGAGLINVGKITEAVHLAPSLQGEEQIRLLLELSTWYLHQTGRQVKDLDSADYFLRVATQLSASGASPRWQYACALIRGEVYYQRNNPEEAKKTLFRLAADAGRNNYLRAEAMAYRQLGNYSSDNDSAQLSYYDTSLRLYQRTDSREGEIDLLWDLAVLHYPLDRIFK